MGRTKRWSEQVFARFAEGTLARIDLLSTSSEDRTDFVREAVAREIERREALANGGETFADGEFGERLVPLVRTDMVDFTRLPALARSIGETEPPREDEDR